MEVILEYVNSLFKSESEVELIILSNSFIFNKLKKNSRWVEIAELRATVRNCAQLFSNCVQLCGIARNCEEFTGIAIVRKKNPFALETLVEINI